MQVVQVDTLDLEVAQALIDLAAQSLRARVAAHLLGREIIHNKTALAGNDDTVAPPPKRITDQALVVPIAVHTGRVDETHTGIDRRLNRADRGRVVPAALPIPPAHPHTAQPEHSDLHPRRAQQSMFHHSPRFKVRLLILYSYLIFELKEHEMKAMQIADYRGAEGLRYAEFPEPKPGAGQVALDVEFAGANYVEALFAGGLVDSIPLPWVPGIEASGRVRSLGANVTGVAPGDRVAALTINGGGAYGQVAVTHAELVAPLPPGIDPGLASVVPSNTTTALIVLERVAHLRPGEDVLVHAAAGGLGSQFGQIAKLQGAGRVVGVVGSEAKRQAALELGFDEVWLREDLGSAVSGQFDVIADPVSGPGRITSLGLLRLGGRLLVVGDAAQAGDQELSSTQLWFGGIGALGFNLGALAAADPALVGGYLRRALALVASGEVRVQVAERAPILETPRVIEALRAGRTTGKTILVHEPRPLA